MAINITLFKLGYFLAIGVISWTLTFFPESLMNIISQLAARTLVTCIIAYNTWPLVKKIFFGQKVSARNKAVLITGCGSGFGNELAKRLHSKGFRVFASCRSTAGNGPKTLQDIGSNSMHVFSLDVTKDESVKEALHYVKENLNGCELWAVVNNAGVLKGVETEWTTIQSFQDNMDVHAIGVVRVTKAFLPLLRRSKGRVVTVTSLASRIPFPSLLTADSMSKFAASCFCECLRQEMHPWGVKVITVEPDFFKTPLNNWKTMVSRIDEMVRNIDEETKEDYGENYFEEYKKAVKRGLWLGSSRTYEVIDSLEDAVMLEEPCDVYRPRGHIFLKIIYGLGESFIPRSLADLIVRIVLYFMGFPKPIKLKQKL